MRVLPAEKILVLTAALHFAFAPPCDAGDIAGVVNASGKSIESASKPLSPYARSRYQTPPKNEERTTLQPTREIPVVVYLEQHPQLEGNPPMEPRPKMDQKNLTIVPHILPIMVGTTVDFPNSDNLFHNLFSLSPARKFDLGRYSQGNSKSVTFEQVGEVRIFCDIHPSMSAVALVLPNRYYAKVDHHGAYRIQDVPAGRYRIHAWHEHLPEQVREVEVPATGLVKADFSFDE